MASYSEHVSIWWRHHDVCFVFQAARPGSSYTPYLVSNSCKQPQDYDNHAGDATNSSRAHRHQGNQGVNNNNKDSLLTIRFDNITDFINLEFTTHSGHSRGMAKSDPRTSGRCSCLLPHRTWDYIVICIVLILWITWMCSCIDVGFLTCLTLWSQQLVLHPRRC